MINTIKIKKGKAIWDLMMVVGIKLLSQEKKTCLLELKRRKNSRKTRLYSETPLEKIKVVRQLLLLLLTQWKTLRKKRT